MSVLCHTATRTEVLVGIESGGRMVSRPIRNCRVFGMDLPRSRSICRSATTEWC